MKVLYFSWVRDRIGVGSEDLSLPENVTSVEGLVEWLKGRGRDIKKHLMISPLFAWPSIRNT